MKNKKVNINLNLNFINNKNAALLHFATIIIFILVILINKIAYGFNSVFITLVIFLIISNLFILSFYLKDHIKLIYKIMIGIILGYFALNIIGSFVINTKKMSKFTSYKQTKASDIFSDNNKLVLVDSIYAAHLADKALGEKRLGNHYHIGKFEDIIYNDEFYAIAPLEFNGIYKYFDKKSSPGYVLVNKYTGAVEIKDGFKIKYLSSSYFFGNLQRKIALAGYKESYGVRFEIDEQGKPFAIFNNYARTLSHNFEVTSHVYTMDLETGKIKGYKVEEAPSWIDNVTHPNYQRTILEFNLQYQDGLFNALFAQDNVLRLTKGDITLPNSEQVIDLLDYRYIELNNEIYMYSGITGSGSEESIVGFMLTKMKTGENFFIAQGGITEIAAMEAVMGETQNFKYIATFPTLNLIDNQLKYFIPLKDDGGLIRKFSLVDTKDINDIIIKDKINNFDTNEVLKSESITGIIERISYSIDKKKYILLVNNRIFELKPSNVLALSQSGDNIEIIISDNKITFTNKNIITK